MVVRDIALFQGLCVRYCKMFIFTTTPLRVSHFIRLVYYSRETSLTRSKASNTPYVGYQFGVLDVCLPSNSITFVPEYQERYIHYMYIMKIRVRCMHELEETPESDIHHRIDHLVI